MGAEAIVHLIRDICLVFRYARWNLRNGREGYGWLLDGCLLPGCCIRSRPPCYPSPSDPDGLFSSPLPGRPPASLSEAGGKHRNERRAESGCAYILTVYAAIIRESQEEYNERT